MNKLGRQIHHTTPKALNRRRTVLFSIQNKIYQSTSTQQAAPLSTRPTFHTIIYNLTPRRIALPRPDCALTTFHAAIYPSTYIPTRIPTRNMSSDADYAAFLDKANQDTAPAETQGKSSKSKSMGTKSVDTSVPEVLQNVEEYFVSDADEPFEVVALKFGGKKLGSDDLKELLGGEKDVEEVKPKGFETQYKKVIDAVKQAGNGDVKIFRVELDGTRAEMYVVTVDEKAGKVVGLKALSVES